MILRRLGRIRFWVALTIEYKISCQLSAFELSPDENGCAGAAGMEVTAILEEGLSVRRG